MWLQRLQRHRWKIQLVWLLILNPFGLYRSSSFCFPLNICPIGVLGNMLEVGIIPFVALGVFGLIGGLVGRLTCGWVCPFGFIQDLIAKIPIRKWNPPRWMHYSKYVVLVVLVFFVATAFGTETRWFFCRICPAGTAFGSVWYWIAEGMPVALTRLGFLAGFVALMVFVKRGFCRLVCPIGAGLGVFNRISLLNIKYEPRWCSDCMVCTSACPVDSGPMDDPRQEECLYCAECFRCSALSMDFSSKKKKR